MDPRPGEPDYTSMSETCGNLTTGCPCDAQYEDRCTNSWGDSWCTPKIWPCPLDCAADEMLCYSTVYDASGHPDWMTPGNQRLSPCEMAAKKAPRSCASMNGSCPCHPVHEEKCTDWWGSWCQPKVDGGCPITCAADQILAWKRFERSHLESRAPHGACVAVLRGCTATKWSTTRWET